MITPSASSWRSRCTIGSMPSVRASLGQCAGAAAEHRPAAGHVVELHDPLGDVERVVVRERDHAGAEPDVWVCWPAAARNISGEAIISQPLRVVLAAPELVEAEPVEVRRQFDVALELERRVLAQRVVRGDEGAELETSHADTLGKRTFSPATEGCILAIPSGRRSRRAAGT